MSERAYTVKELDDLRRAVEMRLIINLMKRRVGWNQTVLEKQVEDQVRTHMMAGHTGQDVMDELVKEAKADRSKQE